jgi:hypothetical protein
LASLSTDLDRSFNQLAPAELADKVAQLEQCFGLTSAFLNRYLQLHQN